MPHAFETQHRTPKLSLSINKLVLLICLLVVFYFGYERYASHKTEQIESSVLISSPKVNDIYFLDFRLLSHDLRPNEKYRLAKVVDITGDIITLTYGGFYYPNQHAVINSLYYCLLYTSPSPRD